MLEHPPPRTLLSTFIARLHGVSAPWRRPRAVFENDPDYGPLIARTDPHAWEGSSPAGTEAIRRDRDTGQVWYVIVLHEGPPVLRMATPVPGTGRDRLARLRRWWQTERPPPWEVPRQVDDDEPVYEALHARLTVQLDVPEAERVARNALAVLQDPATGQVWDVTVRESGVCDLLSLTPCPRR